MSRKNESSSPDSLASVEALTAAAQQIVAQVILEQTGRSVTIGPAEAVDAHLEELQVPALAMALQERFGVTFDSAELDTRTLRTPQAIAELVARHQSARRPAAGDRAQHTVVVLGAGKIGRMVAHFLGASGDYRTRLGDADGNTARQVADRTPAARPHTVDFTDKKALDDILDGATAVISCAPFHCNPLIAERARHHRAHYLDLTEDVAVTEQVVSLAADAECAFIPQCGLAPGFITIVANHLIQPMSDLTDLCMRVGALPRFPNNRLKYNLTWSTEGLINEYCNPCEVILDGKLRRVQPLENLERLSIDGVEYEGFNTSGGLGSLAQSLLGKVRNVNYKSLRYPGHNHLIKFLLDDLGMRDHREALREIFDRSLPTTFHDQIVIYVSATGTYRGRLTQNTYARTVYHQRIDGENWSGIQITTAAGVCAVLDLLLEGALPDRGFVRQEQVDYERFIANRFGRYYQPTPAPH